MNGDTTRLRREAAELNKTIQQPKRARKAANDGWRY